MSKQLKILGKFPRIQLIENQTQPLVRAMARGYLRTRLTPGGAVPRVASLPLCVTPFNILAVPGGGQ